MGYDIHNKVILVTGANRGIGKVILESFIEHGAAKVYAAVRKIDCVKLLDVIGLTEIAEPPILVAEAILTALKGDNFHVFPDSASKKVGEAYQSFSENVMESDIL